MHSLLERQDIWDLKFPFQAGVWETPRGLMLGTFRNIAAGREIKWFEFSYLKICRPNVPHPQVQFQDPVLSPRTIFPQKLTFLPTLLSPLVGSESPVPLGSWY